MSAAGNQFLLPDYRISSYRFTLRASDRLVLPRPRVGIILRGAFGLAFRRLVCHDVQAACRECALAGACPYARVFAPAPPPDAERLRLQSDIPRPFVLAPEPADADEFPAGAGFHFDLVLIGDPAAYLPYFVVAFRSLGEAGIGPGRGRFEVESVVAAGQGAGDPEPVYRTGEPVVRNVARVERPGAVPPTGPVERLTVRFVTPTLVTRDAPAASAPSFGQLLKRARDRASATQYFFCGKPWEIDHRLLGRLADEVATRSSGGGFVALPRRSSRTGRVHVIQGYEGSAAYEGDLAPFLPLLRVTERINVGKAATFGCGRIEVRVGG